MFSRFAIQLQDIPAVIVRDPDLFEASDLFETFKDIVGSSISPIDKVDTPSATFLSSVFNLLGNCTSFSNFERPKSAILARSRLEEEFPFSL